MIPIITRVCVQVWEEGFSNLLRIRAPSQHGKCATCATHKEIIRKLGSNEAARLEQSRLWSQHLNKQFADRRIYWKNRALSRLGSDNQGRKVLTIIIDSMDHSKWALPRSKAFESKAFSGMIRPHLDCTGLIAHGHLVMIAFAEGHIVKGANWTCELLSMALQKLSATTDLREYELHVQADNSSRECKSNTVARYLSLIVARHRVRCARLQCCVTGHSHEDIDQFFSLLGSYLESCHEVHTPSQFCNSLREYLANRSVRPPETLRDVRKIDVVHAWTIAEIIEVRLSNNYRYYVKTVSLFY